MMSKLVEEFLKESRRPFMVELMVFDEGSLYDLYLVKNNPAMWTEIEDEVYRFKGLKGKLVFAKMFNIENKDDKVIHSITILRDNMRISISTYDPSLDDFIRREIKEPNKIVYVKK